MKQEDKELFLKDLAQRLPYGVKISINNDFPMVLNQISYSYGLVGKDNELYSLEHFVIKPYLFPLSSMTEEQRKEYESLCIKEASECTDLYGIIFSKDYFYDTIESIDYLYKNHIDIRGLIPMGLAIDCTNLNIY